MPEPRYTVSTTTARPVMMEPRSRDQAAAMRRYRHGRGSGWLVPFEIRNGLPERVDYVYRGLGYDQLTGDRDA